MPSPWRGKVEERNEERFELKHTEMFHDRFLILDGTTGYHIGASLKDAGKKCFGISLLQDEAMIGTVLIRLEA